MESSPTSSRKTVDQLREALAALNLDTTGQKPELKKRLRKARKRQQANGEGNEGKEVHAEPNGERTIARTDHDTASERAFDKKIDYFLCFDVEATCEVGYVFDFPNEIIEFPVSLLKAETLEIVDEFHSFVRPVKRPVLSDFCIELTGIQQDIVDAAPDFITVLNVFQNFMAKYSLFQENAAAFMTDGPFDIRDFITKQCIISNIDRPEYFSEPWVDIRRTFREYYKLDVNTNIEGMLKRFDLQFEG
ncbi:hypothetical protein BZG36_03417 [Bifiguratus adelaidae]|uniref:SAP domain-containing protein n=1 Tax=Bifiguratus adelaidae TaxID=1938954 RepID=A0A261XYX4_9FUNG|nr:hypothetical protein BZG36_03417 [Bifiguratus adelaidae]